MVHLVIRVVGSGKWVTVEDLSGPVIRFNGHVKAQPDGKPDNYDNDVVVDIHSTTSRPGRAVVYAGQRENDRSAKFLCEDLRQPCVLQIRDEDLRPRGEDTSGLIECQRRRIEPPEEKEDKLPNRTERPRETTSKHPDPNAGADATQS
jgi:hypothetical protein